MFSWSAVIILLYKVNTLLEKFKQAKMLLKLYSEFQMEKSKYLLGFDPRYLAEVEKVINQKMYKTESIKKPR